MQIPTADLFCSPSRRGIFADVRALRRLLQTCRLHAAALFGADPDPFPAPARRLREWLQASGAEEVELILTPRRLIAVAHAPGLRLIAHFAPADPRGFYHPTAIRLCARRPLSSALPVAAPAGPAQQLALF